jgi:PIN domain
MNEAIMDCLVTDYEDLIPAIVLPDPNDRHVLAAAIKSKCDAIVTFNLKDFPVEQVGKYHVEIQHPDDFLCCQYDLSQAALVISAQRCRKRLKSPPKSAIDYLDTLEAQGLPKTIALLREFTSIL